MVRLAGKFALITGGSSGIGLATAKAFVANGARVAITGRDQKTLDAAKEAIDGDHLAFKCDAANLTEIDKLLCRDQGALWCLGHHICQCWSS
jgi:NAD(P)-dependent dehydrogenase (short-subunit alcohol dehydrogenase family)